MIELARKMIQQHEGLRFDPYQCTAGKLTIGYGRNLDDMGVSQDEADLMLENDIARVIEQLGSLDFWHDLNDVRQAVLVDMCFNLGWPRLSGFRKMLAACASGDYLEASKQMADSRWYRQVGTRAKTLCRMMETGDAGNFS